HMLKHGARGIGYGLTNGGDDFFHHLPILHAEIAGKLDRELDILRDQPSACCKEDGWVSFSRFEHRLTTFIGPDLGEVFQERLAEDGAASNGTAAQVSRLSGLPRSQIL